MRVPFFFRFLHDFKKNSRRQSVINRVSSLKTIKAKVPINPTPRQIQAKRLVADMLSDDVKGKQAEARG